MSLKIRFGFRAFVSLLTGFSFLAVVIAGIALYISPQGRIANWSNWTFWGLTKHQWADLHICFCAVLLILSLIHIWLNRRPLVSYLGAKLHSVSRLRLEWIAALLFCGIVYWGALKPVVPFSSLLNLRDHLKFTQPIKATEPPVPHAELLTIEELAEFAEIDVKTILENLRSLNTNINATDVFGEVAKQKGLSPDELYYIALGHSLSELDTGSEQGGQHRRGRSGGGGFGQKTLASICEEMGLSEKEAIALLEAAGVTASGEQTIRAIADENQIHPSEIRQILQRDQK